MKVAVDTVWIALMLVVCSVAAVIGQIYPQDFGQVLVANGLSNPTAMAFAPDGRIFVAQQNGALRVIKANALLATPFVSLTVNSSGERGLIGIAIDPDFTTNNFVYLYYTVPGTPAHNRVSRFTANGDVAQPGSEFILLDLDPLSSATNHNGGAMHFGKDGKLFVAIGENANSANAQSLDTYHGKLLRINKDGSIPSGNPFTTGSEQRRRVWAYGLRNPYTFSIHPTSGRILVNDVGQVTWEEINDASLAGRNFGWPTTEGKFDATTYPTLTNPIYVYDHGAGDGKGCAITGGTFFFPAVTNYPQMYVGRYFLQDLCNAWINTIDPDAATPTRLPFATGIPGNCLGLTVGNDGNVYFLSRNNSALYKIIYNNSTAPFVTNQPAATTVAAGQTATFTVSALGSIPLTYQWQKNTVNIAGATTANLTITSAETADAGTYRVIVSNGFGSVTSTAVTLTIIPDALPVADIVTPAAGATYAGGSTIVFSGTGSDAEDGSIPASSMQWNIDFHHGSHKHDEPAMSGIDHGSFVVPVSGETSDNVWYRITLTVTDSQGISGKDSVDILPRKSTILLLTDPSGLQVILDGQTIQTPASILSVEGILRTIAAPAAQDASDVHYYFQSWSNDGDTSQVIPTPTDDISLTARYGIVVGTETSEGDSQLSVYPNPSGSGEVKIHLFSRRNQFVEIRMVDVLSHEIATAQQEFHTGSNELVFSYGKIKPGVYSILLNVNGSTASQRLIVVE